ncbi:MaoC/PaaZ C-terminal domain-containing protein [Burkholderia multivorans]|uniref:MaoC/PaaZ C-terminal domain-containing protein n=1 Tax=Burkholderia multivorans TaxID=87883 RepID=UPI001C230127|nr:MaoC/PaaZ C-terminal domain-containing protein [Burkholderia multivorans]MBU9477687.1 MaoC family dehydratase N-terminal domain-containing protein [Burkholderia multivorans]
MPISYDRIMGLDFPERTFTYSDRDTMLYALSVGMGRDPLDKQELRYTYERQLRALPSFVTLVAWDDSWIPTTGINEQMIVHGGQQITLHRPLEPAGSVTSKIRIRDVVDKGEGRGALLLVETRLRDSATGDEIASLNSTVFARGDGGFGGPSTSLPAPHRIPDRDPDVVVVSETLPCQALLYRLLGDRNPLHADPAFAAAAGFERPILHGLCTYGIANHAVVKAACDYDAASLAHFEARFTAPVIPGETLETSIWQDGKQVSFQMRKAESGTVVLNNGLALLRE